MAIEEPKYKCPMQSAFFTLKLAAAAKSKNPKIKNKRKKKEAEYILHKFSTDESFPLSLFFGSCLSNLLEMFRFKFLVEDSIFPRGPQAVKNGWAMLWVVPQSI